MNFHKPIVIVKLPDEWINNFIVTRISIKIHIPQYIFPFELICAKIYFFTINPLYLTIFYLFDLTQTSRLMSLFSFEWSVMLCLINTISWENGLFWIFLNVNELGLR